MRREIPTGLTFRFPSLASERRVLNQTEFGRGSVIIRRQEDRVSEPISRAVHTKHFLWEGSLALISCISLLSLILPMSADPKRRVVVVGTWNNTAGAAALSIRQNRGRGRGRGRTKTHPTGNCEGGRKPVDLRLNVGRMQASGFPSPHLLRGRSRDDPSS